MELKGKVALVTGAARGLGRAIAVALADAGCDVAVSDIGRATDGTTPYALASSDDLAAAPVAAMDEAQWDRIFAVNVKGVFLCARAAIPLLGQRGGGRIVNIASVAGKTGRGGLAAYCASKAAVISLTQALAEELGPMNIAVNALCPGYIKTAMWTEVLNPVLSALTGVPQDRVFEDFVQRFTYLKREQTPEEIADAAVYLCRAENVTGVTLTVAGGGEVH